MSVFAREHRDLRSLQRLRFRPPLFTQLLVEPNDQVSCRQIVDLPEASERAAGAGTHGDTSETERRPVVSDRRLASRCLGIAVAQ